MTKVMQQKMSGISLREGEKIIVNCQISPGIFWKSLAVFILALILGVFVAPQLGGLFLIVSVVTFALAFMTQRFLLLVLTNQRVLVRHGLVKLDTTQLRFSSLESVEVQKTLIGHFLGYGNIVLTGNGSRILIIPFVANAEAFRNALDEILYTREAQQK